MSNPDEIRRDIERTRAELSENVNALGDSTSPSNITRGQVDRVKEGAANLKERVFGAPEDPHDDGAAGDLRASVDDAKDAVADTPRKVKSGTRGNPLAAGLIAMGVGALVGGLIPSSRKEQEMAHQVKDAAEPLVAEVKQMANQAKDNLQPVVQDATAGVKDVAQDAGEHVRQDAVQAKDQVTEQAKSSADTVKQDGREAAEQTRQDARRVGDENPDRGSAGEVYRS